MPAKTKKTAEKQRPVRDERERAKQIIIELIRQNGGEFSLKTKLYKAFYYAHLKYAEKCAGYLSGWPIVRMPRGPGIHQADDLLNELVSDGLIKVKDLGGYDGFSFALTKDAKASPAMEKSAVNAIRYGVRCVTGKTAKEASDDSHEKSRSWLAAENGEELNIYADISDAQTHRKRLAFFKKLNPVIAKAFGE